MLDDNESITNDNRLLANRPPPLNDSYLVKTKHTQHVSTNVDTLMYYYYYYYWPAYT